MYVFLVRLLLLFYFLPLVIWAKNEAFFVKKEEGIIFPTGFLKGVSSSTYQNGGHAYWKSLGYKPKSNWTWFENEFRTHFVIDRKREDSFLTWMSPASPIDRGEKVGLSADSWNHMFDDIQRIKALGCNAYRFELPWTDCNPEMGVWNEEAFTFFDHYIDALIQAGIEPIITLYHWVHPRWFHDLNAWEKEENNDYFVRYCQKAFERYGHKVRYWCTINEPTVISAGGYILGTHAPGKKDHGLLLRLVLPDCLITPIPHNYSCAGMVLGNLFKAHIAAYKAIKALPNGESAQVSLTHQAAHFKPFEHTGSAQLLNPISRRLVHRFNTIFGHDVFMRFFKTGEFVYHLPRGEKIIFYDETALQSLDFVALNFYADVSCGPMPMCDYDEQMSDMSAWAIRPESLYDAIKEMSSFNLPIIITENGICDAKDDRRETWIISYCNAVKQALDDGYDVRGYCYWSLVDNFEWNMGHNKKFGLYAVNTLSNDPIQKERFLRNGSKAYRDYMRIEDRN